MYKHCRRVALLLAILLLAAQIVNAAPAVLVNNMRFSQTPEKIRIVFDLSSIPTYDVNLEQQPLKLVVNFDGNLSKSVIPQTNFNDEYVRGLKITEVKPGKIQAVIDLKQAVVYKVFTLKSPNRLVIDISKEYDHKLQQELVPGIQYITWYRSSKAGPVAAHIVDLDPKAGYMLKPVLSNGAVAGLETVQAMAEHSKAVAAINGSYFGLNGEIIGLLKINGQIASTPGLPRTALGILADGSIAFDRPDYSGSIKLPNGQTTIITGVNCERGEDDLILYNDFYDDSTNTNEFGIEYVITDNKVTAKNLQNSPLQNGSIVLSAHGKSAEALASLKVGDTIKLTQSLGETFDKTVDAIGAGPMLVKDGKIFLTTKVEEFGSDVAGGRAPRTAVGLMKNGHIILVVVDGRQQHSLGMTLYELAAFMQELGADAAMNLDGGGSSEMVINGEIVNSPSDGHERRVGDALVIVKKDAGQR